MILKDQLVGLTVFPVSEESTTTAFNQTLQGLRPFTFETFIGKSQFWPPFTRNTLDIFSASQNKNKKEEKHKGE